MGTKASVCRNEKYYCNRCKGFTLHNFDKRRKCNVCGYREGTAVEELRKLFLGGSTPLVK